MLHPEETRVLTWGQYGGLKAASLTERDLVVTARYKSSQKLGIMLSRHTAVSAIRVKSFASTDASDHNWDKVIAERLGELVKVMSK